MTCPRVDLPAFHDDICRSLLYEFDTMMLAGPLCHERLFYQQGRLIANLFARRASWCLSVNSMYASTQGSCVSLTQH